MKEEKPKIKPWMKFLIFLGIAFLFALLGHYCGNPDPCTVSGIGCHDGWQMIQDTWVMWVSTIGIIGSMFMAMFTVASYKTD